MVLAWDMAEPIMPSSIAALPPPNQPIQREPEYDGAPDVPEIAFSELWQDKGKGFSFGDFLDIINPLQHIPVISTIYRMVTDDDIGPGARVAGGALFGGPLGVIGAGLTAVFEETSGGSVEEHVAALWNSVTGDKAPNTQIAATVPANGAATATARTASEPQKNDSPAYADDADDEDTPAPLPAAIMAATPAGAAAIMPVAPIPPSPQPMPRPPVSVSPLTAVHRTQAAEQAQPDPAADRQRIAQSIERAQKAQAGLLLANVGADKPAATQAPTEKNETADAAAEVQNQPFKPHPYLLPRGAPPEMVSRAMEQALAKYQTTLQQRNAPMPVAIPLTRPGQAR